MKGRLLESAESLRGHLCMGELLVCLSQAEPLLISTESPFLLALSYPAVSSML